MMQPITPEIRDKAWRDGIVVRVADKDSFQIFASLDAEKWARPMPDDYCFILPYVDPPLNYETGFTVYYNGIPVCGRVVDGRIY